MIFVIEISATHCKPLLKKMRTPPVNNDIIGNAKKIPSLPLSPDLYLVRVRTFDIFLGNHNFVFIVLKQPSLLNVLSFRSGHNFVCQQFFQANSKHFVVDQGAGRADRSFAPGMHEHGLVG